MASTSQDEKLFASPARPPSYKKIPNCDNSEDHSKENHDQNIPFHVQTHFDNVRQLYLKFMNEMGDPQFKERVLAELEAEKKKNIKFTENEKQLKAEIDHLTRDLSTLVTTKFGKLRVFSKSHLEFIKKAKNIMSQHHELQKDNGTSKETEDTKRLKTEALESHCELIRQINLERKKIIQTKEKEMIAGLVNRGMTETDAKIKAKLTIESVINALKEDTEKVENSVFLDLIEIAEDIL